MREYFFRIPEIHKKTKCHIGHFVFFKYQEKSVMEINLQKINLLMKMGHAKIKLGE